MTARAPLPRRAAAPRSSSAGLLAVTAALLALGCEPATDAIQIDSIRVAQGAVSEPLRRAGLGDRELAAAAREALAAAGFRLGSGGRRAHRARFDVLSAHAVPTGGGALRVELAVELELVPLHGTGDPVREAGRVSRTFADGGAATAWQRAIAAAAQRAAQGLALAFAAEEKPREALLADLDSGDPRARAHAARVLGARRDRAAVSALVERLEDEHPDVVERAVAALARIGDRRAVPALIELSRRTDAGTAARFAHVVGDLGGDEAEGYLLTVEAGHPDPRVRRAAREALGAMEARRREDAHIATGR